MTSDFLKKKNNTTNKATTPYHLSMEHPETVVRKGQLK